MEVGKFGEVANTINSVGATLQSSIHVNDLIKSAHQLLTAEFTLHMSRASVADPSKFSHVYEWGKVGDANARLWRYNLVGFGANRVSNFEFKASQTAVPVAPALAAIGVQKNHIFYWKAPVFEYGLPVRISPKLAKVLVFQDKNRSSSPKVHSSWVRDGIVYSLGPIVIPRQGNSNMWNAFTNEYAQWWRSAAPGIVLDTQLIPITQKNIFSQFVNKVTGISKKRTKTFSITPIGLNPNFIKVLEESLHKDYIAAARTRRMLTDDQI